MIYNVKVDDTDYKLEIFKENKKFEIRLGNRVIKIDSTNSNGSRLKLMLQDNVPFEIELSKNGDDYQCWLNSRMSTCEVIDEKTARFTKLMGSAALTKKRLTLQAPMPGLVVDIEVEVGQEIKKGDGLIVVEAMKMENELRAYVSGRIKAINVEKGQAVEKNQVLIEFE